MLVYGWRIDYDKLVDYLRSRGAKSCKECQCTCGPVCWKIEFPDKLYYVRACNYAYSEIDFDYAISLVKDTTRFKYSDMTAVNDYVLSDEVKVLTGPDEPEVFTL